jgi:hypothetical protein
MNKLADGQRFLKIKTVFVILCLHLKIADVLMSVMCSIYYITEVYVL